MKYLNIPDKRFSSIFEKNNDFDMNSEYNHMDNTNDFSFTNVKQEILSEKNEKEEKEVNIKEIVYKMLNMEENERFLKKRRNYLKFQFLVEN